MGKALEGCNLFRRVSTSIRAAGQLVRLVVRAVPHTVYRFHKNQNRTVNEYLVDHARVVAAYWAETWVAKVFQSLLQKGQLFHNGRNGRETKATKQEAPPVG